MPNCDNRHWPFRLDTATGKLLRRCCAASVLLTLFCLIASSSLLLPQAAFASQTRLALVLGGGGARGGAHVGILKQLDAHGIVPDIIVGTSFGSLVGGLYAAGNSGAEIEALLQHAQLGELFQQITPRDTRSFRRKEDDSNLLVKLNLRLDGRKVLLPNSLVSAHNFRMWLKDQLVAYPDAQQYFGLDVKFAAVGTDLVNGREIVLDSGLLEESIYASMALPGLMEPVDRGTQLIVDGGLVNNLPISTAMDMGATHIIAVDVGTPFYDKADINSSVDAIDQMARLLTRGNTEDTIRNAENNDQILLFRPNLDDISTASFDKINLAFAEGERVAKLRDSEIQAFKGISARGDRPIAKARAGAADGLNIASVNFTTDSRLSDRFLASHLSLHEGDQFNRQVFEKGVQRLYGTELFNRIVYSTHIQDTETTDVSVNVLEKRGRSFVQFGLTIDQDFEDVSEFGLGLAYTKTQLNSQGAEWRTKLEVATDTSVTTELYQPFGSQFQYFASASMEYSLPMEENRESGDSSRFDVYFGQIALGRYFSNWGSLSWEYGEGEAGDNSPEDLRFDVTHINFQRDTLNDPAFPTSGLRFSLSDRWTNFKATALDIPVVRSNEASVDVAKFVTDNNHTAALWGTVAANLTSGTQDSLTAGGFLNLSGFEKDSLNVNKMMIVRALYYHQLTDKGLTNVFNIPLYLGGSLEHGSLRFGEERSGRSQTITAASVFVGANSVLGPLFLGVGRSDSGEERVYLSLGRPFVYELTSRKLQL